MANSRAWKLKHTGAHRQIGFRLFYPHDEKFLAASYGGAGQFIEIIEWIDAKVARATGAFAFAR